VCWLLVSSGYSPMLKLPLITGTTFPFDDRSGS
jgi:hypothetical protein